MSVNHQDDEDHVADFAGKSEAVFIGEEKGDDSENLHRRKKWQSNVTIVSCVSFATQKIRPLSTSLLTLTTIVYRKLQ
jgi:hypothetical protein